MLPPVSTDEQIARLRERFENAFRAGEGPRIDAYLAEVEPDQQGRLLVALLAVDVAARANSGEAPSVAEYQERFPDHARPIDDSIGQASGNIDQTEDSRQVKGSTLRVRCPHCQNLVEATKDESLADLICDACGSHFSLVDPNAKTRSSSVLKTLGHFDLVERLGMGANGEVWKVSLPRVQKPAIRLV